ncbi:HNH endonuclease [Phytoactinopolyspora limicola]|uniref:HNH endonuclease n=1 Tax=Phytoactinopolyspora limicola TaxID=2715536 RepID=UPI001409CA93|nr:HNH endonuclease signature motif containing protein [Phytoactinopolyspora limicola]
MNEDAVAGQPAVVGELASMLSRLAELPTTVVDDAARIDLLTGLERLKAAAAATQYEVMVQFATSQRAARRGMGFAERHATRGVPEQIGLATKTSPSAAARQLSRAQALTCHLPATFDLLRKGEISEFAATVIVNETSHLDPEQRRQVDARLAGEVVGVGPRRVQGLARRYAIEADPAAAVARAARARKDRRVGIRPAPDTMTVLSALLPCEQGVAAYAALRRHADAVVAAGGDGRSRDQIMADTLVERLTGQASADAVSAEIGLVMTDSALLGGDNTEAAELLGYGPIPAETARDITRRGADNHRGDNHRGDSQGGDEHQARVFLRRLFTDPVTGVVVDCDPRRRRFDGTLARLLTYRDGGTCRDPYCDAPIRHFDHIHPYTHGGPTTPANGRGTCARGNYVKQMPGWTIRLVDPYRHIVETTTPTGHRYTSHPPTRTRTGETPRPNRLGRFADNEGGVQDGEGLFGVGAGDPRDQ